MAGFCEYGDEPSGSIKYGEFVEYLRTCQLLRKDSGSWLEPKHVAENNADSDWCCVCDSLGVYTCDLKYQRDVLPYN